MLARNIARALLTTVMTLLIAMPVLQPVAGMAQEQQQNRKVKTRVEPNYPELARRMNLAGTVKCQVVVTANGSAKSVRALGGNPVLIEAATEALRKWKWEPGQESTEVVAINFVQ